MKEPAVQTVAHTEPKKLNSFLNLKKKVQAEINGYRGEEKVDLGGGNESSEESEIQIQKLKQLKCHLMCDHWKQMKSHYNKCSHDQIHVFQ